MSEWDCRNCKNEDGCDTDFGCEKMRACVDAWEAGYRCAHNHAPIHSIYIGDDEDE